MMRIIQGVTETITATVNQDITNAANVELWINTFSQTFVKNKGDLDLAALNGVTTVSYKLTQEESLSMCEDYVSLQLRWIFDDGTVDASDRQIIPVTRSEWQNAIEA